MARIDNFVSKTEHGNSLLEIEFSRSLYPLIEYSRFFDNTLPPCYHRRLTPSIEKAKSLRKGGWRRGEGVITGKLVITRGEENE
jgi:hypothetical protein